jgi:hypothetical protein
MFDKNEFIIVTIISIILIAFIVYEYRINDKFHVVVYVLRMAEISPDFPIEARNQCRKLSGRI